MMQDRLLFANSATFGEQPAYYEPMARPPKAPDRLSAVVKWYNATKGFGFVTVADGTDAFLHVSALGQVVPIAGQRLSCQIEQAAKGWLVKTIYEWLDPPVAAPPEPRTPRSLPSSDQGTVTGTIKFFSTEKKFGFIEVPGQCDLYLPGGTVDKSGIPHDSLKPGTNVKADYLLTDKQRGPYAVSLTLMPFS